MEVTLTTYAAPSEHSMDLAVTLTTTSIDVGAGQVVLEGRSDALAAQSVPIASRPHPTLVFGYLAREVATDSLVLFVDEHIQDGVDEAYTFEREGPYRLLAYLFRVVVPAYASSLASLDYDRWRIIPEGSS